MSPIAVILLSLVILLHRVTPDPSFDEKQALLSLFEHLKPDGSYVWKPTESPCSWKGVLCDPTNTTVIQLSLSDAHITGNIPNDTMGELKNLLVLSLRNNDLSGFIPADFTTLELNELYLDRNNFSGAIPYIRSDNLEMFDVSGNNLSCDIPYTLSWVNESAFYGNDYLCGSPLPSCNRSCPFEDQDRGLSFDNIVYVRQRITLGVTLGLALLLLIIVCCFRRKIRKQIKQPRKPSIEAPSGTDMRVEEEGNKLELFDDENNGLVWDELVQGSAEVLGRGSVGTTYKRVLAEKKMTVVLKRLKDVAVTVTKTFESQMKDLGKMKNENVVPLRGYYCSKDEKWVVYDYMHGGSLFDHLRGLSGARLNWNHRMQIALSVARGLAYLHAHDVVHGNIKSSNVLLQQETNKDASVSDYGLNTLFDMWSSPNSWVTGYWAPELIRTQKLSSKSDVYSFGVLLLELLTSKAPDQAFADRNDFPMWVQFTVCKEPNDEIFDMQLRRDENMKEMLQMLQIAKDCVSIVPDQRPTMLKVVSMMEEMEMVETVIES